MRLFLLNAVIASLVFLIIGNNCLAGEQSGITDLEGKVRKADVVVVGEFMGSFNQKKAKSPITIVKQLKGNAGKETKIVVYFRAGLPTIAPKKGSKWIFLLQKPFRTEGEMQYRKIVGKDQTDNPLMLDDDFEGILPATDENLQAVTKLLAKESDTPQGNKRVTHQ